MVIGNGLIAKAFSNYNNSKEILIFASGVSNSLETNKVVFDREFELIKSVVSKYPKIKFVYFSTLSITDDSVNKNLYVIHKLHIEKYIKENISSFLICRVSNVVGFGGNKHTIVNYLFEAIKNERKIKVWSKAERNLIDIEDVKYIVDNLIKTEINNNVVTIASQESVLVIDILNEIELFLNKKAKAEYIIKGNKLNLNVSHISHLLKKIEMAKGSGLTYINNLLNKYY